MASIAAANYAAPMQAVKWQSAIVNSASTMEAIFVAAIAIVVLRLEYQRRAFTSHGTNVGSLRPVACYAESCKRILCQCIPETLGLFGCLAVASALLARGDSHQISDEQQEMWLAIKRDWPLLTCGDTLLSIQSMLRFVVLLSVLLHGDEGGPDPIREETAAFLAGGCAARFICYQCCPLYMLEGPLGGNLPAVCDLVSTGLAFVLGRNALRKNPLLALCTALCIFWLSYRHNLNLSEEETVADALFMVAYFYDCIAALMQLARSLLADFTFGCASLLRNLVMAVQATVGAYYFVYAFSCEGLTAAKGAPCEVLLVCNFVAGAAYLSSAGLLLADASLGSDFES